MTAVLEKADAAASAVTEQDELILAQVKTAVEAARDKKALDVSVLRLVALTEFTDYFVIFSGSNTRQVQAIADEVALQLKKQYKLRALNKEGYAKAEWILIDFGTFVVHVFVEASRRFYDLERLWRDAERVEL
ncbi:MAG: ribosome silencing factor [Acidobacteria bacterium]|nr:ribosome silencing factor [Acidobacteriota bacterium]